jgi:hypothetical protein
VSVATVPVPIDLALLFAAIVRGAGALSIDGLICRPRQAVS